MLRKLLCALLWGQVVVVLTACPAVGAAPPRLLAYTVLAPDASFAGSRIGGLSGIEYLEAEDVFLVLSDDRGDYGVPRAYTLRLSLRENAGVALEWLAMHPLRDPLGESYAAHQVDPEALRQAPGLPQRRWWASEGDAGRGVAPAVIEADTQWRERARLPLPPAFFPRAGHGVRDNAAFESLALLPDGALLYANEKPLLQDGPLPGLGPPARVRLVLQPPAGIPRQYVYVLEPLLGNGLVELLALGSQRALALERAYQAGRGNSVRLYEIDWSQATALAQPQAPLSDVADQPVAKRLLLDLATLGIAIDNLEAMSLGPRLANGRQSLVLVSDDNFNSRQITQFLVLELDP